VRFRLSRSPPADLARSFELAKKSIEVDRSLAWGYIALEGAYLANGDADAAVKSVREALMLEPNSYEANLFMGFYLQFAGDPVVAVEHLLLAKRVSPRNSIRYYSWLARAQFMERNYSETVRIFSGLYRDFPRSTSPNNRVVYAAAYALLDKPEEAAEVVKRLLITHPNFNL
jgi:tetratricopeptide (TPR) repeat protein